MRSFTVGLLAIVAVLSLTCNVFLYLRYSSSRPLVTVGKDVITKKQFQDQLERQAGQDVLSKMVFAKLVNQAAARQGVTPTPTDVDNQIKDIQRRSPQLLAPYNNDPAKVAELKQDIQTSLALENLRIKDGSHLTPAQVAEYYATHKAGFALPQQVQTATVVTQNSVSAQTAEDLLRQGTPLDVLARRPNMNVVGMNNFNPDLGHLPAPLGQQISAFVQKAHDGAIKTFSLKDKEGDHYLTFRVTNSSPATVPALAHILLAVQRQAALAYAPTPKVEIARLYHKANPTFSSDRYAAYFDGLPGQDAGKKTASGR